MKNKGKGEELQPAEIESDVWKICTYLHGIIQSLGKIGRHASDAFH